jgi:phosphoribosylanthranilate isomerase
MTTIKICGVRSPEIFRVVAQLDVEYCGFVFAPSRRQVTAEQVREMVLAVRESGLTRDFVRTPKLVGVFVDEDPAEVLRVAEVAGLDVLQLHGQESPAVCRMIRDRSGRMVWKAWGVCQDERDQRLCEYRGAVDAVLLDNAKGGTGVPFSWEAIPRLREMVPDVSLLVAGGLHPGNVEELLSRFAPDGVDVSSGVESGGVKDQEKIVEFVAKVRRV